MIQFEVNDESIPMTVDNAVVIETGGSGGKDGKDGFSPIANVTQTDDGAVITITDKEGTTTATIRNGVDGKDGIDGKNGQDGQNGKNGVDGKDGYTPVKGVDYFDGKDGQNGKDGMNGQNGYTPVKGVDYYTDADKQEMVNAVLAALPDGDGVSY